MKKALSLIMTIAMMLTLVACGGSSASGTTEAGKTDKPIVITLAHSYPDDQAVGLSSVAFKELVEEKTDGRVTVTIFSNGTLCASSEELNMLASNAVNIIYTGCTAAAAINPLENVGGIPFTFVNEPGDYRMPAVFLNDEINEILAKGYEGTPYYRLGSTMTECGCYMVANNKHPVEEPADMKGLKIRTPGGQFMEKVYNKLGATMVSMSVSEFPVALQQGAVDGVSNCTSFLYKSGWHSMIDYLTLPNIVVNPTVLLCNNEWWNSLPADIRDIIENEVFPALNERTKEIVDDLEKTVVDDLIASGVEVTYWDMENAETLQFCKDARQECIDLAVEQWGEDAQRIIDIIMSEREAAGLW